MTTDRSRQPVDTNSRIVVTGGVVGLTLGLIGAMSWADRSSAGVDSVPLDVLPAAVNIEPRRIIVILPDASESRAQVPAAAVPSSRPSTQAPVSRSQGS